MTRQSISLTEPNDSWLKAQLSNQEYSSKSEIVNDLIRKARKEQEEIEAIRAHLITAEKSGFTSQTEQEILSEFKADLTESDSDEL